MTTTGAEAIGGHHVEREAATGLISRLPFGPLAERLS